MTDPTEQTIGLLARMRDGDAAAASELMPLVYEELRAIARRQFRGQAPSHTLQPTALAHEAFMRLAADRGPDVRDRGHFMAVAATAMRQILIDHARKRRAEKRGGGQARVAFADDMAATHDDVNVLDLDEALRALSAFDERKARVVELRFFTGLDQAAIAEVLGVARSTVAEDWRFARAWLLARLQPDARS